VIQATWMNNRRKPLDDPRVRRALHLALDKPVLVDVVKDVAPMVGGFIYPFSEFATPKEELGKRLGYQSDPAAAIKEARALMAAAGHANGIKGLDYLVRDVATFKLWSQAIQAMLQESLNIECNLRTVVESVWFDDTKSGNFDLAIGAIVSTLLDPSDYFNAWYGKDGPQNYSFWDNHEFQALTPRIDQEVDAGKRLALIRQAEGIMEQDPPLLPVSWEKINEICTAMSRATIPLDISAYTTSSDWIRSGWTSREPSPCPARSCGQRVRAAFPAAASRSRDSCSARMAPLIRSEVARATSTRSACHRS
jgi:peptide/nickel transport system substrate-binding protein